MLGAREEKKGKSVFFKPKYDHVVDNLTAFIQHGGVFGLSDLSSGDGSHKYFVQKISGICTGDFQ